MAQATGSELIVSPFSSLTKAVSLPLHLSCFDAACTGNWENHFSSFMNTISYFLNWSRLSFLNTGIQIRKQEKKKDEKNLQNVSTNECHLIYSPSDPAFPNFWFLLGGLSWVQCPGLPWPVGSQLECSSFQIVSLSSCKPTMSHMATVPGILPLKDGRGDVFWLTDKKKKKSLDSFT